MTEEIIAWSHSSLKLFETCPRQYQALRVTREFKSESGPEADWGNEVHEALELYVKHGTPLPSNMRQYQKWPDGVMARPGETIAELAYGVSIDRGPSDFFAEDVWHRGKIDLLKLHRDTALVLDYKTGKVKHDNDQLVLYSLVVFALYPEVQEVRSAYIWLAADTVSTPAVLTREQADANWARWQQRYDLLENAYEVDHWPCKPSGLCPWCPVKTCKFWKPKRVKR